jgi:hypothetical protein
VRRGLDTLSGGGKFARQGFVKERIGIIANLTGELRDELRPHTRFERESLHAKFFFSVMRYDSAAKSFRIFLQVVGKALHDGKPDGVG